MESTGQRKTLDRVAIVAAVAAVAAMAAFVPAQYWIWVWAAAAGVGLLVLAGHVSDLLTLVLVWIVTVACMSYWLWKYPLPFVGGATVNVTIDRLFALALVAVAAVSVTLRRTPWRTLPTVARVGLVMIVYFTVSMLRTGATSIADVNPHFRLIGGYVIPGVVLVVTYLSIREQNQIAKLCWFFFFFGLYLTLTAWAEQLHTWSIVFPAYIRDADLGIHWGRSRGPFLVAVTLGYTLVFCLFNNLYLAARTAGAARLMIYATNVLMIPAIFFTQTRSVWLATLVCTVIWMVWSHKRRSAVSVLTFLAAVGIVLVTVFWSNIASRDRREGGVTDPYPIYARIGLAKISGRLFIENPVAGVGFGHFRDQAARLPNDPASKYIRFGSRLMEHNNFLSIATETGIIGLALYVAVLWMLFKASLRVHRRLAPRGTGWVNRDFVVLYWVLLADYVIDAMFRETSVDPFNNGLLAAVSGVILAMDYLLASGDTLAPNTPTLHAPDRPQA